MTVIGVGNSRSVLGYRHDFPGCTVFAVSPQRETSVTLGLLQSHVRNNAERECFPRIVVGAQ